MTLINQSKILKSMIFLILNFCFLIAGSKSYSNNLFLGQSSKEIIFEQLAVQDAMNSFFGTTNDNLSSGPISSKEFSSKMEDTYDVIITPKNTQKPLFLGISKRFQLNNFLNPELNLKYKSGHSSYYLPAGLKPFSDPIDLKINYTSISINAFLVYEKEIFPNLNSPNTLES